MQFGESDLTIIFQRLLQDYGIFMQSSDKNIGLESCQVHGKSSR